MKKYEDKSVGYSEYRSEEVKKLKIRLRGMRMEMYANVDDTLRKIAFFIEGVNEDMKGKVDIAKEVLLLNHLSVLIDLLFNAAAHLDDFSGERLLKGDTLKGLYRKIVFISITERFLNFLIDENKKTLTWPDFQSGSDKTVEKFIVKESCLKEMLLQVTGF